MPTYALKRTFPGAAFGEILARTRAALVAQGFGVPTEMDTRAIFLAKLGKDTADRVILGACLAPVALEALQQEPDLAVLLPCNVVVRDVGNGVEVAAIDPTVLFSLTEHVDPAHAEAVRAKLQAALNWI